MIFLIASEKAPVAQLDRALGYDQEVLGSNPSRRTINEKDKSIIPYYYIKFPS